MLTDCWTTLNGLNQEGLKLILFGGKGGVGKTTCASSTGLYLAQYFRTLLISTDPAHSLSDSLGQDIGESIREVKGMRNLSAVEANADRALSKFKIEYEDQIKEILNTSTYLDEEDINSVFLLPIPGIDEIMSLKTIVDLIEEAAFDKYVVDTAPTGHALKLLALPVLIDDWIKVIAKMRWKYKYMVERFSGSYNPDKGDDLLLSMKKAIKRIENLLRDPKRCEFIAVTIPEDMAIAETERMVSSLADYGIKVKQLIINNALESQDCAFCRERKKEQEKYLLHMKKRFSDLNLIVVPLQAAEVKGIRSLENFKELLFGQS